MDLLLWRHAHARDANPGEPDWQRPLTAKGRRQAEKMGDWLRRYLPANTLVLCSPAVRALETVHALRQPFQLCDAIAPEGNVTDLLHASQWPESPVPVLMVGHQPTLSQAVRELLGLTQASPLAFRKGAVWWLRFTRGQSGHKIQLLTVIDPEFL